MKKTHFIIIGLIIGLFLGMFIGYKFHEKKDEVHASSYFVAGYQLYEKKQYPEAAEMFNRSVGLDPDLELSHWGLIDTYRQLGFNRLMEMEFKISGLKGSLRNYTSIPKK